MQMGPCKRTFKAPEPHGFIIKLLRFKSKQMRNPNSHIDSNIGGVSIDSYNETATCPLNIVSIVLSIQVVSIVVVLCVIIRFGCDRLDFYTY